jgi:GNAT superfamily N-acetyltransferase
LEVLPEYQKQGIGKVLMEKILEKIKDLYMIDLICDQDLNSFYKKFDFKPYNSCILRNLK